MVTVTVEVRACEDCPHATNSAREHNDPFTSEPYPVRWFCNRSGGILKELDA